MVVDVYFLKVSNSKVRFVVSRKAEGVFGCFIRAGLTEFMELSRV
jgi:hypothetical protein